MRHFPPSPKWSEAKAPSSLEYIDLDIIINLSLHKTKEKLWGFHTACTEWWKNCVENPHENYTYSLLYEGHQIEITVLLWNIGPRAFWYMPAVDGTHLPDRTTFHKALTEAIAEVDWLLTEEHKDTLSRGDYQSEDPLNV